MSRQGGATLWMGTSPRARNHTKRIPRFLLLTFAALCLQAITPTSAFTIHPQIGTDPEKKMLSPLLEYLSPDEVVYPISGQLVRSDSKNPTGNFTQRIALVQMHNIEDDVKIIKKHLDLGLTALVLILDSPDYYPGITEYQRKKLKQTAGNTFPIFEITKTQSKDLDGWFKNQTGPNGVWISFDHPEPNPWHWVFTYYIPIFANILLAMTGVTMVIGCYKYILLIAQHGFQVSISQMVLLLNLECLILRFVWLAADPFGAYQATPAMWVSIGQTLPFAFSICGMLLITLYWHEMIHRTGTKINMFLSKLRIPFWITAFLIIGGETASSVVRGLGYHLTVLLAVDSIIYAVVILILLIFFIHTKRRLNKIFKEINKNLKLSKQKKLSLATNIVITMTSVLVAWFIAALMMATGSFSYTPGGYVPIWTILILGNSVMCLMQVLLIRAPYRPWRWIVCGLFADDPQSWLTDDSSTDHISKTPVVAEV